MSRISSPPSPFLCLLTRSLPGPCSWGRKYNDLGAFRLIRRPVLDSLDMQDRGFGWTVEMQASSLPLYHLESLAAICLGVLPPEVPCLSLIRSFPKISETKASIAPTTTSCAAYDQVCDSFPSSLLPHRFPSPDSPDGSVSVVRLILCCGSSLAVCCLTCNLCELDLPG